MKLVASAGREDIALVYIIDFGDNRLVECVEALQPPLPRHDKWILLVSTMFGCPIQCAMCDAGGHYEGKPTSQEILAQIDFLVTKRFPDRKIPCNQFKIQLARMGEPSLNPEVLAVLKELPSRYNAPGLMPSLSTIAPRGADRFFDRLLEIKNQHYSGGHFQFQFSLHTTDQAQRDRLIPVKKWTFREMADYGERFYQPGDRKVTLNFALAKDTPINPQILRYYFDPEKFLIKITPLNPTYRAATNKLDSYIDPYKDIEGYELVENLQDAGYRVIVSIGEVEENNIGSNCGQFLHRHLSTRAPIAGGYTYQVQQFGH